ncbi:MAG TPA: hypothetical protein VF426_04530, partial [Marmoricola sp.]
LNTAHRAEVAHGRLAPEAVLVTHSGAAKVIGFAVSAAIEGSEAAGANAVQRGFGDLDPFEADVINLAGILYSSLTGRWPGLAPSDVPPAPYDARGPLRPRQVRAGVPRMLDAICERVLRKEGHEHLMPLETAYEVFAALTEHIGDPATAAPTTITNMHDEPTATGEFDRIRGAIAGAARVNRYQRQGPSTLPTGITPAVPPEEDAPVPDNPAGADTPVAPEPVAPFGRFDRFDPHEQPAPLPPFVDSPERPLFADTVPAASTDPQPPRPPEQSGEWPFGDDLPDHDAPSHADRGVSPRNRWLLFVAISLVATAIVVGGVLLVLGR